MVGLFKLIIEKVDNIFLVEGTWWFILAFRYFLINIRITRYLVVFLSEVKRINIWADLFLEILIISRRNYINICIIINHINKLNILLSPHDNVSLIASVPVEQTRMFYVEADEKEFLKHYLASLVKNSKLYNFF